VLWLEIPVIRPVTGAKPFAPARDGLPLRLANSTPRDEKIAQFIASNRQPADIWAHSSVFCGVTADSCVYTVRARVRMQRAAHAHTACLL
jgi:hypothetical protein